MTLTLTISIATDQSQHELYGNLQYCVLRNNVLFFPIFSFDVTR